MIMLLGKSSYIASSGEGIPQSGDQSLLSSFFFVFQRLRWILLKSIGMLLFAEKTHKRIKFDI